MKILFLHGWTSVPGGRKPSFLIQSGHDVQNPALPDDNFGEAVRIAQAEFEKHQPDVVVGSSRGGSVAMNIDSKDTPLVLLCPAWKRWGAATRVKPNTTILHSRADDVVPFGDSEQLVADSGLPCEALVEVGHDHRLADPEPLEAMVQAVESHRPTIHRYTPEDLEANRAIPERQVETSVVPGDPEWFARRQALVRHRDQTSRLDCPYGHVQRIITGGEGGVANVHVVRVTKGTTHVHTGYDEVYYVLSGTGAITLDRESHPLRPGSVTVIPAGAPHSLQADPEQELEFIIFGTPPMSIDDDRARPKKVEYRTG